MTIDELIEQLKALPKDVRKHPLVDGRPAVGYRLAPLERISVERVLTAEDGYFLSARSHFSYGNLKPWEKVKQASKEKWREWARLMLEATLNEKESD